MTPEITRLKPICANCGDRRATMQCDFEYPDGRTCDAHLCGHCAVWKGWGQPHCPRHEKPNFLPAAA